MLLAGAVEPVRVATQNGSQAGQREFWGIVLLRQVGGNEMAQFAGVDTA